MLDEKHYSSRTILVVDDAPAIRESISTLLADIGFSVRTADNGLTALAAIRKDMPNFLLSDLNMPEMSGFELLSVVRRRYPAIRVIAMSGSFSGNEVPSGVIADGFFGKGCSVRSLLRIIEAVGHQPPRPDHKTAASSPLWLQRNRLDPSALPYVMIACPACLRSFKETVSGSLTLIRETRCLHCAESICYAIADPVEWERERPSTRSLRYVKSNQSAQSAP